MKLVAKIFNSRFPDDFPNGMYEVSEYNFETQCAWIWHNEEETVFDCDASHGKDCEASVHLSTGMFDKNGREILVGDDVMYNCKMYPCDASPKRECTYVVLYDGKKCFIDVLTEGELELTPDLAAMLEVVQ